MKDPIVIDPSEFDQRAAWNECAEFVDRCGGLERDGEVNWRAAFGADPGVTSCPNCCQHYWQCGNVQRCVDCGFEYPVNWWPMYSQGCQDGRLIAGRHTYQDSDFNQRMVAAANRDAAKHSSHAYYQFGFRHPVKDPWFHHNKIDWKFVLTNEGADMYTPSDRVTTQLASTFSYRRPQGNQAERYERLRDEAAKMANLISANTPESREQSIALTKLEEVVMFANAAIARNEEWDGDKMLKPLQIEVPGTRRRGNISND